MYVTARKGKGSRGGCRHRIRECVWLQPQQAPRALGPGAGRSWRMRQGCWRQWGWLSSAPLHLMFKLERHTTCSSLLRNTLICQAESAPAPRSACLRRGPSGQWEALGRLLSLRPATLSPGDGFEKRLLSFLAALDWPGRQRSWEVVRAAGRRPLL